MSDETIKQASKALEEFGKKFAEMVSFTQEVFRKMTPEQRAVVDFLAENPKVAEAFQELNQKLARQRAIEGATKEATQPAEPLIKDEKIRKAVRAWAEACGYDGACIVEYDKRFNELSGVAHTTVIALGEIDFDLEDRKRYTIAELCGEEEE